ncbi:lipid-A-disaccharide synthase [Bdellovibrionota bacterium FG-1]
MTKVLISAAETSSDAHGAELLRALKILDPTVEAFGVGGPRLQGVGLRTWVDARELLAMGFFEIFSRLPRILRALKKVGKLAAIEKPDVAVVIDYPDFHFRLARRLRTLGIPVVYYIPPKVWVWRKNRIRILKEQFAKVLSILPFEVEFYQREKVPVCYVGNPLVDELPLEMTREQARNRLDLSLQKQALVVMPGSRPSEIRRHLGLMLDAAKQAAVQLRVRQKLKPDERLVVLMPFPVTSDIETVRAQADEWVKKQKDADLLLDLRVSQGDAHECLVAADAGLIKSGTSTLEAALLKCPHVIVYKPNWVTEFIYRHWIRYPGPVGLSNLIAGWSPENPFLITELLCSDATVEALAVEALGLLLDPEKKQRQLDGFSAIREKILPAGGESPSAMAAREVLGVARAGSKPC